MIVEDGLGPGCRVELRIAVASREAPPAGPLLSIAGRWRSSPGAATGAFAGVLRVERWSPAEAEPIAPLASLRGDAATRLFAAFGARAPLANALVMSRTEGLDPDLRDAFARSGIAHLLSISGFHVAVVAALLVALLRLLRAPSAVSLVGAMVGVWGYVLSIGAPDAGVRAALLFSVMIVARWAGRPLSSEGSLASSFLLLALLDPGGPGRPGFQLSFAGAAGLTRLGPAIDERARVLLPRIPSGIRGAFSAGLGATLATIPIVAWHFERVSLVGIPGTMVAGPLVAVAIPGVLLVLLVEPIAPGLARFLAGGTDVVLAALVWVVDAFASPSWASVGVNRGWVLAALVGVGGAAASLVWVTGVGRGTRRLVMAAGAALAIELAPMAQAVADRGTVGIEMLDVGQGDAILVRSPGRRWVLIDAGPRSDDFDAGLRLVLPALRRRGIRRLEALVLTHPHLDHMGGAPAVLHGVRVAQVLDPGQAQGAGPFIEALEAAAAERTAWSVANQGEVLRLDGMTLEVLHPPGRRSIRTTCRWSCSSVTAHSRPCSPATLRRRPRRRSPRRPDRSRCSRWPITAVRRALQPLSWPGFGQPWRSFPLVAATITATPPGRWSSACATPGRGFSARTRTGRSPCGPGRTEAGRSRLRIDRGRSVSDNPSASARAAGSGPANPRAGKP